MSKVEKREVRDTGEVEFRLVDERDVHKVIRFKKPQSTYVDWWLRYLEQEIELIKKDLKELKDKLKGRRARP